MPDISSTCGGNLFGSGSTSSHLCRLPASAHWRSCSHDSLALNMSFWSLLPPNRAASPCRSEHAHSTLRSRTISTFRAVMPVCEERFLSRPLWYGHRLHPAGRRRQFVLHMRVAIHMSRLSQLCRRPCPFSRRLSGQTHRQEALITSMQYEPQRFQT